LLASKIVEKSEKKNLLQGQQETQGVLKNKILSDKS